MNTKKIDDFRFKLEELRDLGIRGLRNSWLEREGSLIF
jgi:hypothetical protein